MLNLRCASRVFYLLLLLLAGQQLCAQRSVSVLRAATLPEHAAGNREVALREAENFTFDRNLIFFEARVNGEPGNFILDTGAPTLVMNNRGEATAGSNYQGFGSGGSVELSDHRVEVFEMSGLSLENYWAIGLDLRGMESRTGQRIDGMVGYDLLNDGELRIDYSDRSFRLLPSERRPLHDGAQPRAVLRFSLIDHLPVVRLRINGRRYDFAIDTGAGSNLVDEKVARELKLPTTGEGMNILGLDGRAVDADLVTLAAPAEFAGGAEDINLVTMDLSHLDDQNGRLAGILGSAFLSQYTIGIDYRRRRIYVW